ncbi:MAG: polysaccharide biosynthesis protein [Myxococcales bacterium]|nr:polysaccharide biosynthesis protein [Myxococcales bacterium]
MWLAHVLFWMLAYAGAWLLRFDFQVPEFWLQPAYALWLLPLVGFRTVTYAYFGLFHGIWKYVGQRDLEDLILATAISTGLFGFSVALLHTGPFPRSIFLVEPLLSLAMAAGLRFSVRTFAQTARRIEATSASRRLLLVGAGDAGEALLREIVRSMPSIHVVGILDDDEGKHGMSIHGVRVLGAIDQAGQLVGQHQATEVLIAIPGATGAQMRRILDLVSVDGVSVRTVPGVHRLVDGRVTVSQIREVAIEDLLGREPVELDTVGIGAMIRDEVVLVTGAGGSIGSELCRQVARFQPRTLVLVEQAENALYHIHQELKRAFPQVELWPRIADIADRQRLDMLFGEVKPGLVLHAAAHKHVPMMEWNPGEAVKNNVGGTANVVETAHNHRVARFVMISTDKAVNPTSVMGCTKRVAELYVQSRAQGSATSFVTVRFGNVLGSNGSVIPLFREQIRRGGPVTVTHPDMQRYFMTIPEASQLVLEAATLGESGEIYVLDMGKPVRITTLAEDLIRLSGLKPGRDVEIVYTGVRPGEKLFEELAIDGENTSKTKHPKIFVGIGQEREYTQMQQSVSVLLAAADTSDGPTIKAHLKRVVPRYTYEGDHESRSNVISLSPYS